MRAAVEEVTLAHSVITEFDSLTGSVSCNIETKTLQVRCVGKLASFHRLHTND